MAHFAPFIGRDLPAAQLGETFAAWKRRVGLREGDFGCRALPERATLAASGCWVTPELPDDPRFEALEAEAVATGGASARTS